jgi:acyl dehydratase
MSVAVGQSLGPLVSAPITTRQLVMYAGASGDYNPIHYDDPFARAGGFRSVIAHGMLSMAFFGRLLAAWQGPTAVERLQARFKAVTYPGDVVTVSGEVTAVDPAARRAEVRLTATNQDGVVTLEGSATVRLSEEA